jgi:cysteine synthase A
MSRNANISLTFIAASKKYKSKLIMPTSMSMERTLVLNALGSEYVLIDAGNG